MRALVLVSVVVCWGLLSYACSQSNDGDVKTADPKGGETAGDADAEPGNGSSAPMADTMQGVESVPGADDDPTEVTAPAGGVDGGEHESSEVPSEDSSSGLDEEELPVSDGETENDAAVGVNGEDATDARAPDDAPASPIGEPDASTIEMPSDPDALLPDERSPAEALRTECPEETPANGAACDVEGVDCRYGDHPRYACRPIASCSLGRWVVTPIDEVICPATREAICPATLSATDEESCEPLASQGLPGPYCAYSGVTCECILCGSESCPWVCEQAPVDDPACTRGEPNFGTACPQEGLLCTYDSCYTHWCIEGYWTRLDNCGQGQ